MDIGIDKKNIPNTAAFAHVREFKGQVVKINIEYARELANLLQCLERFDFGDIEIGVETDSPLLVFLDKDRKTAFAIAPRIDVEE